MQIPLSGDRRPAAFVALDVVCGNVRVLSAAGCAVRGQTPAARCRGASSPAQRTAGRDRRVSQCAVRHERGAGSQAIRKDFPAAAAKLSSAVHPSEKTTFCRSPSPTCCRNTGTARISYIFGYRSKKLIQINVVWASDGSAASDETIVATANSLRDYFASQNYKPDSVVANRQLAENTILVFRASDVQSGRCFWC